MFNAINDPRRQVLLFFNFRVYHKTLKVASLMSHNLHFIANISNPVLFDSNVLPILDYVFQRIERQKKLEKEKKL